MSSTECKTCGGKGHVMCPEAYFNPLTLLVGFAERNDKEGITRDTCSTCNGSGYVESRWW